MEPIFVETTSTSWLYWLFLGLLPTLILTFICVTFWKPGKGRRAVTGKELRNGMLIVLAFLAANVGAIITQPQNVDKVPAALRVDIPPTLEADQVQLNDIIVLHRKDGKNEEGATGVYWWIAPLDHIE